jgi:hypothetical protein
MKVGDLVCLNIDTDQKNVGIVIDDDPEVTETTHPSSVVHVIWANSDQSYVFKKQLKIISRA